MSLSKPFFVLVTMTSLTGCQADLEPLVSDLKLSLVQMGMSSGHLRSQPSAAALRPPAQTQPPAPPPTIVSSSEPSPACSDAIIQQIISPASEDPSPMEVTCVAKLPAKASVTRQIVFEGAAASGASLDCNGGRLQGTTEESDKEAVVIRSKRVGSSWIRPVGVSIRNCEIAGGVRIYGMGRNGEAMAVKQSSLKASHTADAQAAAPVDISFDRVTIVGEGGVPFYVSPGVTNVTLTNSSLTGSSTSVGIYLDAESAGAKIADNTFSIRTKSREVIAIDGSAYNTISDNHFTNAANGGIYVYRNCGEGGTIRHQAPRYNKIEGNTFSMVGSSDPAIWLNSRNGNRSYCFQDPRYPFGSSLTPMDMAQDNIVSGNKALGGRGDAFRNNDPSNTIANDVF